MSESPHPITRRELLSRGMSLAGVAAIPLLLQSRSAFAIRPEVMHYTDAGANPAQVCAKCNSFIPGKTPDAIGECYIINRGAAINPKGHCDAWSPKP